MTEEEKILYLMELDAMIKCKKYGGCSGMQCLNDVGVYDSRIISIMCWCTNCGDECPSDRDGFCGRLMNDGYSEISDLVKHRNNVARRKTVEMS